MSSATKNNDKRLSSSGSFTSLLVFKEKSTKDEKEDEGEKRKMSDKTKREIEFVLEKKLERQMQREKEKKEKKEKEKKKKEEKENEKLQRKKEKRKSGSWIRPRSIMIKKKGASREDIDASDVSSMSTTDVGSISPSSSGTYASYSSAHDEDEAQLIGLLKRLKSNDRSLVEFKCPPSVTQELQTMGQELIKVISDCLVFNTHLNVSASPPPSIHLRRAQSLPAPEACSGIWYQSLQNLKTVSRSLWLRDDRSTSAVACRSAACQLDIGISQHLLVRPRRHWCLHICR